MNEVGYVYTLNDPENGEPKYVGATKDPSNRLSGHLNGATNQDVSKWIAELEKSGKGPNMTLVRVAPLDELSNLEKEVIKQLSKEWELFNRSKGGYSPHVGRKGVGNLSGGCRPQVTGSVEQKLIEIMDEHGYPNMQEAIRHALREGGYDV